MRIKKIGPEQALALGRLEANVYPPFLCLGWQDFKEDLEQAEAKKENFSFGLFQGEEIVGYLVAYVEDGEIFVSDLAVLPSYRVAKNLAALLMAFFQAVSPLGLPIVAECRQSSFGVCAKHPRFFRQFGYRLAHSRKGSYCGEPQWEIRFEFVGKGGEV